MADRSGLFSGRLNDPNDPQDGIPALFSLYSYKGNALENRVKAELGVRRPGR